MRCKTFAVAMIVMLMAVDAHGAMITYTTLGRFNGGAFSSSATITVGGESLTFNGLGSTSVDPGNISYGTFDSNAVGAGGTIPPGTTFDLQINQTTPSAGSATASATLSGTVTTTSSSVQVLFSTTLSTIGAIEYVVDQPPIGIAIVSPSSNSGLTTIQGRALPIPEPASAIGAGVALVTLGLTSRRRAPQA